MQNSIRSSPLKWGGGMCGGRDEKGQPRSFTSNVTFLFSKLGGEDARAHGIVLSTHTYFVSILLHHLSI